MYTGRLEVTLDNIYSVLLATHLLHMPGALEQCRAALLRLRGPPPPPLPTPPPTRTGTILRPVPNRLVGPPLCWSQPGLYPSAPVGLSHLPNLQIPPSLTILPNPGILQEPATSAVSYSFRENSPSPPPAEPESQVRQRVEPRASPEIASTSFRRTKAESSINESDDEEKKESDLSIVDSAASPSGTNERTAQVTNELPTNRGSAGSSRSSNEPALASTSGSAGVVYDVACCDGPVRFHRVLNENYVSTSGSTASQQRQTRPSPAEVETNGENDENGRPEVNSSVDPRGSGVTSGSASYTCGYCRHTFKSHYCYKKHARRHLLPTAESEEVTTGSGSVAVTGNAPRPDGRRREVKLLDLNVQYYPCKICGSKFPSYYFVHKHRKLCHSNVEERSVNSGDGESSGVGPQQTSDSSDP